jgi:hypothetical protein
MPKSLFQLPPANPPLPYHYKIFPSPPVLTYAAEPFHDMIIPDLAQLLLQENATTMEISFGNDGVTPDIPYLNVLKNEHPTVKQNPWIHDIRLLRYTRYVYLFCIQGISKLLVRKSWRLKVDALPEDHATKHYMYHHNPFFRYLSLNKIDHQGFNHICYHLDGNPMHDRRPLFIRNPRLHPNPLLTWEEDEFLFHASIIFALFDKPEMATALRLNRDVNVFMKEYIRELLDAGYLDPLSYFDKQGRHRPIRWDLKL